MKLEERKTAEMVAEPIQVCFAWNRRKESRRNITLNIILETENKHDTDIDICRWRSICGTAYRYIGKRMKTGNNGYKRFLYFL